MKLKFKGKPWKTGNAYVVTVPKAYIDGGVISREVETEFEFQLGDKKPLNYNGYTSEIVLREVEV